MQVVNDPGTRPEFYRELLVSDPYILIVSGDRPHGTHVAQEGETLEVDQCADLIRLGQGSLDHYFESRQPFFQRQRSKVVFSLR